jgi:hypothetical protein
MGGRLVRNEILGDNDIRPSVLLLISTEKAGNTLQEKIPGQIPAYILKECISRLFCTNQQQYTRPNVIIPQEKVQQLIQRNLTFFNITETGDSVFEMIREISLRTNRPPIGQHLKTVFPPFLY